MQIWVELEIDGIKLDRVTEKTLLGVIIDQNFNWKPNINHVRSKLARTVGILCTRHFRL